MKRASLGLILSVLIFSQLACSRPPADNTDLHAVAEFLKDTHEIHFKVKNIQRNINDKSVTLEVLTETLSDVYPTEKRNELLQLLIQYQTKYNSEKLYSVYDKLGYDNEMVDAHIEEIEYYINMITQFRDRKPIEEMREYILSHAIKSLANGTSLQVYQSIEDSINYIYEVTK